MNVKITVLASHAYASITRGTRTLDMRLDHGKSAPQSLRDSAADFRRQAGLLTNRAEMCEGAAAVLDSITEGAEA